MPTDDILNGYKSNYRFWYSQGTSANTGGVVGNVVPLQFDRYIADDIKKLLEQGESYTNEDLKLLEKKINNRLEMLEESIADIRETNKKILEKLNFICERKKKAINFQRGIRG